MDQSTRALLEEVARREALKERTDGLCRSIYQELFDRQQRFHDDKSRRKGVLGSRRAGKTEMWARILSMNAQQHPRTLQRVWSHARLRAKELLWDQFRYLHGRHGIDVATNETELSIRFPNDAVIRLVGADKDKEVQKKRGDKTLYEVLLEAQSWDQMLLEKTVEDVVSPSLFDLDGTVCLEGTPGPIPVGYWYDVSGGNDTDNVWQSKTERSGTWSVHRWTMLDNPFMRDARAKLAREKVQRRWADDNPTYVREYLGRWVRDDSALYYPFDELRNTYEPGSVKPYGKGWSHALGWDLGSRDDMALVIWGWHEHDPNVYEVFSWKKPGALSDEVMSVIDRVESSLGLNLIEQVVDTGGGGKMYVEEVMSRFTRRFTAAKKTQKAEHARLLGDDLRTGHIKLIRGSPYAMEIAALMRDPDWDPSNLMDYPGPAEEDPRCANHCCFVAGTLVLTRSGEKPIESITTSDEVLTRRGWRRVVKHAPTGVKAVVDRLGLRGTPDHPVWTENRGWVRLDSVLATDVLLYACELSQSSGAASPGEGTPMLTDALTASTTSAPSAVGPCGCIEQSGQQCTAPCRPDTTCTTSTATRTTTTSKTSPASRQRSTSQSTVASDSPESPSDCLSLLKTRGLQQLPGIAPTKVEPGTESTQSELQQHDRCTKGCAESAARRFAQKTEAPRSAAGDATLEHAEPRVWMTRPGNASSAGATSESTSTPNNASAGERALVFALTVDDCHEYFANGVLVSNCDAGLYSWRAARHYFSRPEPPPEPVRGTKEHLDRVVERMVQRRGQTTFDVMDEGSIYGFGAEDE